MFLWSVSLSVGVEAGGHRTDFPFSPPPSLLPFLKATLQRGKLSTFISANDKSMRRLRRQNGSITSNIYRTDLRFDFSFVSTVQRSFFRLLKYMVSFHMVKKKWIHKNSLERNKQWTNNILSDKIRRLSFVKNRVHRPLPKNKAWWPKVPRGVFRRIHGSRPFSNWNRYPLSPRMLFNAKNYRVADYSYGMRAD